MRSTAVRFTGALLIALAAALAGCATEPARLMRMRSLAQPAAQPQQGLGQGEVVGLAALPRDEAGRIQASVLFVHGIGWTQDKSKLDFASDFIGAIATRFGVPAPVPDAAARCPRSQFSVPAVDRSGSAAGAGGARIVARVAYSTDYHRHRVLATEVACVDKTVVDLREAGRVTVYRVLWDDLLYDAFQFPHIGYDDPLLPGQAVDPATEDIDALRHRKNSELKTNVVTYGINDAAMYFGPVGQSMRTAVGAALCLAIDDAAGVSGLFAAAAVQHEARDLCQTAGRRSPPFTVVAESLGSRIVYDLLTDGGMGTDATHRAVVEGARRKVAQIDGDALEVFFLANQLPIFGVGRLGPPDLVRRGWPDKPLRFVAISEIDDPLTFEMVPYFEHLYLQRCRLRNFPGMADPDCEQMAPGGLSAQLLDASGKARRQLLEDLGFESVVDVRVRFAGPFHPLAPNFIDPQQAHTQHIRVPFIRDLMVCGAKDGAVKDCSHAPRR